MMEVNEAKAPFVRFEMQSIEDREKTLELGSWQGYDVAFALITPHGSRDTINMNALEWFKQLEDEVQNERFPANWLQAFRGKYEVWLKGETEEVKGTPIKNWTMPSPSQKKMILALNIFSVESLAEANEDVLQRLGMGGRLLKQKAIDYLKAANSPGKLAEQMEALRVQVEGFTETNKTLQEQNEQLKAQLAKAEKGTGGNTAKQL